jgi:hypothetical protein
MTELEGGDVGSAKDFVVCIHAAAHAMGAGVFDLQSIRSYISAVMREIYQKINRCKAEESELTSISRKFSGGP